MKLLADMGVSVVFHPVALVLSWGNSAGCKRQGIKTGPGSLVSLIWGLAPIVYVLLGGGLW